MILIAYCIDGESYGTSLIYYLPGYRVSPVMGTQPLMLSDGHVLRPAVLPAASMYAGKVAHITVVDLSTTLPGSLCLVIIALSNRTLFRFGNKRFGVTMDDLKDFRQLDSVTPGHPENFVTAGIEVSTGPLGQGISNAVGMAMAERHLAATFNKPDFEVSQM